MKTHAVCRNYRHKTFIHFVLPGGNHSNTRLDKKLEAGKGVYILISSSQLEIELKRSKTEQDLGWSFLGHT